MKKFLFIAVIAIGFVSCGNSESEIQNAYSEGLEHGKIKAYNEGYEQGVKEGYKQGYHEGYEAAYNN